MDVRTTAPDSFPTTRDTWLTPLEYEQFLLMFRAKCATQPSHAAPQWRNGALVSPCQCFAIDTRGKLHRLALSQWRTCGDWSRREQRCIGRISLQRCTRSLNTNCPSLLNLAMRATSSPSTPLSALLDREAFSVKVAAPRRTAPSVSALELLLLTPLAATCSLSGSSVANETNRRILMLTLSTNGVKKSFSSSIEPGDDPVLRYARK